MYRLPQVVFGILKGTPSQYSIHCMLDNDKLRLITQQGAGHKHKPLGY